MPLPLAQGSASRRAEQTSRIEEKLRRELGPQVCGWLDDPAVIEIMLNADGSLWVERLGAGMERKNILVVGGTSTGKTTFANAVIEEIRRSAPEHRLVVIEDTAEIQSRAENKVMLRAVEGVDMTRLLKATMRLRPDRICVGEVRGPEALALLKAWNTGHPGGVATVHANHSRAGLVRLEQLIAEISQTPMPALIGEAVDVIVAIEKTGFGRRITEVLSLQGYDGRDYCLTSEETL